MKLIRCIDVKDKSKINRINYLFKTRKLTRYVDEQNYVCFDQEQFEQVKKEKRGRKI